MLVVPQGTSWRRWTLLIWKQFWTGTSWACMPTAASAWPCAQQRAAGRPLRQRIQVTGLDAMCRMIDNGLGVGLLPDRAFALMRSVGRPTAVPLTDAWARRELRVVARDFDALPVTSRLLVEHLTAPRQPRHQPRWPPRNWHRNTRIIDPPERRPRYGTHPLRQDLGRARCPHRRRWHVHPLHRPAPGARGDQPAGL